jgi:hypothetical protein
LGCNRSICIWAGWASLKRCFNGLRAPGHAGQGRHGLMEVAAVPACNPLDVASRELDAARRHIGRVPVWRWAADG